MFGRVQHVKFKFRWRKHALINVIVVKSHCHVTDEITADVYAHVTRRWVRHFSYTKA